MISRLSAALLFAALAETTTAQYLVKDITPGTASSSPTSLANVDGTLYLRGSDGVAGAELWRSDGTSADTVMVADINAGAAASNPGNLLAVGSVVYFSATDGSRGIELWKSDGTAAGTTMVADINPGGGSSSPSALAAFGPYVFFAADDGVSGRELWKSDGTAAGTTRVADIAPGAGASSPANLVLVGATLYFTANDGTNGTELWQSTPPWSSASTAMVADIYNGSTSSSPSELTVFGTTLFFRATSTSGIELWKSDGTAAGTVMVADINPGSGNASPTGLTVLASFLFFSADDGTSGFELWRTDGTQAGTTMVKDINPGATGSNPGSLVASGATLFFTANDGTSGIEPWRSQPPWTSVSTAIVKDINPGSAHGISPYASVLNAKLLYPAAHNIRIIFGGIDGVNGTEPWMTDGTAINTVMLADLNSGTKNSAPNYFTRVGDLVFFSANDGVNGTELYAVPLSKFGGALAEPFGRGCPGTGGLVPTSTGTGLPVVGNASFGFAVSQALPSSAAILIVDAARGALALPGGCTLYVPQMLVMVAAPTNASGAGTQPFPLPNSTALVGAGLFTQWAVLDPGGAFLKLLSFSDGLQVLVGR